MAHQFLTGIVDLAAYPIDRLDQPEGRQALAAWRRSIRENGVLVLPQFLTPTAIASILREAEAMADECYYCAHSHNPYLAANDDSLPADHPRNALNVSDVGCLADDLIPASSLLRHVYNASEVRGAIAAILGFDALYPYDDPLGSLNINLQNAGQQLNWHYDNADFVTTILLQDSDAGGAFEYCPDLRQPTDENYDAVGRVLAGERAAVRSLDIAPGALVLFRGRYSLHRVTPVEGTRPRIIAILSYDTKPGVVLTEFTRRLFYGRVA
ncbi:MAG: 2OG-Fe(II) oxygenase [Rhodospirillaceae bacterium]|nr:2OG-Fe(II) oxygenase [Rhodospirillaceae bacterium]